MKHSPMPAPTAPMKRTGFKPKVASVASNPRTAALPTPKPRKCALVGCRVRFTPRSMTHRACGLEHALAIARGDRLKKEADAIARREAMKPRAKWLAETQAVFNTYIRARDAHLPCISCGRMHQGAHDAGHYLSVGAMPTLRFHEDNVHRQCVPCNQHLSGNIVRYRIGLLAKIGAERLAFLEGPHAPRKYAIEELAALKAEYKVKTKKLKVS